MQRQSRPLRTAAAVALALWALASCFSAVSFVGPSSPKARGGRVVARVGAGYLERNGPRDADTPWSSAQATGPAGQSVFKKRPFGVLRYQPGSDGNGAMAKELVQQSRYPGDPQGQAFVAGVQDGWVVKSINGQDVSSLKFEAVMDMLDDEVADPRFSKSTELALQSEGRYAEAAELPLTIDWATTR